MFFDGSGTPSHVSGGWGYGPGRSVMDGHSMILTDGFRTPFHCLAKLPKVESRRMRKSHQLGVFSGFLCVESGFNFQRDI